MVACLAAVVGPSEDRYDKAVGPLDYTALILLDRPFSPQCDMDDTS
jgi:hypothetical protein